MAAAPTVRRIRPIDQSNFFMTEIAHHCGMVTMASARIP